MPSNRDAGCPADPLDLASRVPPQSAGRTLADYLAERFRYHSATVWREEIQRGRVFVNGRITDSEAVLRAGAEVLYRKPHREPTVNRNVRIMHEDDALLVLDKPAHLPMHADGPFVRHTLVHILRTDLGHPEAALVHRLDRETSGLVLAARTTAARKSFEQQFAARQVQKTYYAVVHGDIAGDFTCTAPVGHCAHSSITLRRSAASDATAAKPARTQFVVLERGRGRTLLRCTPTTGRTHQIRVHLERAGHPLLGDKLYGRPDADYLAFVQRMKAGGDPSETVAGEPPRQLLHASELRFLHPTTGAEVYFESPLPEDFRHWLLAGD